MSEKLRVHHEHEANHEKHDKTHEARVAKHHETLAAKARHEHLERLEHIRKSIDHEAKRSSETLKKTQEKPPEAHSQIINGSIEKHALKQNLRKIQRSLTPAERQLSKIIHNEKVDAVSEVAGQTIARPSGLLVGGAFALFANLAVIAICRYYGYEYNYLIGIVSFGIGFILGVSLEPLLKSRNRNR